MLSMLKYPKHLIFVNRGSISLCNWQALVESDNRSFLAIAAGNKMEHIPEGFILHIKVMAWAFGTIAASVCTLSLHLYCWLQGKVQTVHRRMLGGET